MTRRFRLLPISTSGGFSQTIILPPAVRQPRERETPDPGGDCAGVADPPSGVSVRGVITGDEICWSLLTPVPEGYTAEPPYCDQSESPGSWEFTRACDGEVFNLPVTSVEVVE